MYYIATRNKYKTNEIKNKLRESIFNKAAFKYDAAFKITFNFS